jgi:spore maturation protein SpmB
MISWLKHSPVRGIIMLYVLWALVYAAATPPLEASDELWHMGMVSYIADTGSLPVQQPGTETAYKQEGSQPPLYYLLSAALVAGIDRSDFSAISMPNPHAKAGIALAGDNKNLVLRPPSGAAASGTALAVALLRGFSILLGAGTVYAVYRAALICLPVQAALLAAGVTAFNPMFLFIAASVNNDNLVTFLNSVIVWQMLATLQAGFEWRRSLFIALLFALASLSKLSGLVLAPFIATAGLVTVYRSGWPRRAWAGLFMLGGSMVVVWAVVGAWWYVRNITLYGELFGTQTMVAVAGPRLEPFSLTTLLAEFEGFRIAYWGLFGAVNILTWPGFYLVMDVLVVLAGLGLALRLWRRPAERALLLLLTLLVTTGAVSVIAWTAQTYASQGRLLFPVSAATSTLLAAGWHYFSRRAVWGVVPLMLVALAVPVLSIAPRYVPPPRTQAAPAGVQPVYADWGDIALVGYHIPQQRYAPGDDVPVTVVWQVEATSAENYSLFLHALAPNGEVIGKIDTYPGGGTLQTRLWQPGYYADHYRLPLDTTASGAFRLRVQVGWYRYPSQQRLAASDETGQMLEAVALDAGGFADARPQSLENATPASHTFGPLRLESYSLEGLTLRLLWQADSTPDENYIVFVQAVDDNGIVGQGDAPPDLPTLYWRPGERYVTQHTISPVPAGTYPLLIGWYRLPDFQRLPTARGDGAYELTQWIIP